MFAKIWEDHEVARLPGGVSLLHVDRHLIHDLEAGPDLTRLAERNVEVRRPDLTYATPDHAISGAPGSVCSEAMTPSTTPLATSQR